MTSTKKNITGENIPMKPFLKWAGGKRQLLPQFDNIYPLVLKQGGIKNYYEPFLGSGAVFFDIAQRYNVRNAFLSDVNPELVLTYQVIQANVLKLIAVLSAHEKKYLTLDKVKREKYFYNQRDLFNKHRFDTDYSCTNKKGIERAAQLIFLNRTCYNGLFRVNSKGEFNTPAGNYQQPSICGSKNLIAASKLLSNATIVQQGFTSALKNIKPSSFIYFDPPYRPLSKTASFTAYSKSVFQDKEQILLANLYRKLDKKGALLMLSNSDSPDNFFDTLYKGFTITKVPAKRLINKDASKRGYINEIVVTNYRSA